MEKEQLQQLVRWLNDQINQSNTIINDAQKTANYGKSTLYEGMREAFVKCLTKVNH